MDSKIDIHKPDGALACSPLITKDAKRIEALMGDDYIMLSWNDIRHDILPAGTYITFDGEKWTLLDPYTPEQKSETEWKYEPLFQSRVAAWSKIPCFWYVYAADDSILSRETDWCLTDTAANMMTHLSKVIMQETGEMWTIVVASYLQGAKTITVNSTDVRSVLNDIAGIFETEWYADKKTNTLYLGNAMFTPDTVPLLKVGDNIGIPSVTNDREGFYNRFYVFGSTRNITQDYAGANVNNLINKRLTLDPAKYPGGYIDKRTNASDPVFSKILVFDEIYPKSNLVVREARPRLLFRLDDTGNKIEVGKDGDGNPVYDTYAIWYLQLAVKSATGTLTPYLLPNTDTYDKDHPDGVLISGKKLSVHFEDGALAGREFELAYHAETETLSNSDATPFEVKAGDFEVLFVEEGNMIIPSLTGIVPADGNKVILFNLRMPAEYTAGAYETLEEAATKEISEKYTADTNNYEVKSNPVAFSESNPKLGIGMAVTYVNAGRSTSSRVISLTTRLDCPTDQTIIIGNNRIKRNTETLREEVTNANRDLVQLTSFSELTQATIDSYNRTLRAMTEGFARISRMWQFDDEGNVYTEYNVRSNQTIIAHGDVVAYQNGNISGGTGGGGLDITALEDYLTTNGYATQAWVSAHFNDYVLTKAAVEAVLTGNITSHTHNQYLTAHQSLANYVTLNTAQTISGAKTFSNTVVVQGGVRILYANDRGYLQLGNTDHKQGEISAWSGVPLENLILNTAKAEVRGAVTATQFIRTGGTASQFLKADGSVDSNSYLLSSAYTAADILTKIKTVDGAGSGLDADTVDGVHGSSYLYATCYCREQITGVLVKTDVPAQDSAMFTVHINGNTYKDSTIPIDTYIQFYSYGNRRILSWAAINNGYNFGAINVFIYEGYVCLWLPQPWSYTSFNIFVNYTNSNALRYNRVISVTNTTMPTEGVTRLETITPKQSALTTDNVASATKLQTARTINGTAFDGTAAITTAKWGTARNLTIGNTAKSVDGSGNVAWSLAEIGALGVNANAVSASKLQTAHTLWGQSFDGTGDVSGTLSGVEDISFNADAKIAATANHLRLLTKSGGPQGIAAAQLLASDLYSDWSKVPANGIYSKGDIATDGSLKIGGGTITWDAGNNAFMFSHTVASQGDMVAFQNGNISGGTGGGGLDITALEDYLTTNGYATQDWVAAHFNDYVLTKAAVEAVLTGNITSHTHSQYLTAHQSLANYVTLNTAQTISGAKTFSNTVVVQGGVRILYANQRGYLQLGSTDNKQGEISAWSGVPLEKLIFNAGKAEVKGVVTATQFIRTGGTASQFLKADGSVDANTYLTEHQSLANYMTRGEIGDTYQAKSTALSFSAAEGYVAARFTNTALATSAAQNYIELWGTDGWFNLQAGYLLAHGAVTATQFIRTGGTATQFLKADGSVDSNSYLLSSAYTAADILTKIKTVDGAGSGLDADTLDGVHGKDYMYRNAYNFSNGCLVRLKLLAGGTDMVTVHIKGNSYRAQRPIDTWVQFYNYAGNYISSPAAIHNGYDFGDINVFCYDGHVYLWFKQTDVYQSFSVYAECTNNPRIGNLVEDITNAAMPESGVSGLVTIVPMKSALITDNVASATKLQTARTINGTAFDGTAAITTAKWGTARNLTIGNTAKSVDGSAPVAWSLAEIGALGVNANAVSASKLATPHTLWGQSFDGTDNVAGTLSGVEDIIFNANARLTAMDNALRFFTKSGGAQGIQAGNLLISNLFSDANKVPENGIYSKDGLVTDGSIKIGGGTITWDEATNSFIFSHTVASQGDVVAFKQ